MATRPTTRRPTTARQAIKRAEKAGISVSRVVIGQSYRTFDVRSEHAAKRIAKAIDWDYFQTAGGHCVMIAECPDFDAGNCR